ncbi:MAG TPA: potassium transporter Kup [Azospirillaceae bacterium]|nr:potassium transporter Kup [Azospirillaceae bacterium]
MTGSTASTSTDHRLHDAEGSRLPQLVLGAMGIVFGDIGTSPLYTLREAFGHGGVPLESEAILGVLSLILWSLMIVVTAKYVAVIMRADNRGEGGVLALAALALRGGTAGWRSRVMFLAAILGTALFFGDSLITPAISVLSAVEGLHVATPVVEPYVVPIAVVILIALFVFQKKGTGQVGRFFGPVMALWFTTLAVLGVMKIIEEPSVLQAVNPIHAMAIFSRHGGLAFAVLGAVVLAVTGAEALYADMGHFGRKPIRYAWLFLVLPALLLNYFGQGALLIRDPGAVVNPFFLLAPSWGLIPMVLLATAATVIASQAVISGAFSLTRQAIQLGYLPRREIRHTSHQEMGQIYIPAINWILLTGVLALVVGFGSSSALASAYGIAVTGAMVIDGFLAFVVARKLWRWSRPLALLAFGGFIAVDVAFLAATSLKIPQGGWFPLLVAALLLTLMVTWRRGRVVLFNRLYRDAMPMELFIKTLTGRKQMRVPGTAVYMTGNADTVPHALLHNLKHNKILHERVVIMTVQIEDVPWVRDERRVIVVPLDERFWRVVVRFGFMERPNVPGALKHCQRFQLDFDMMDTSFFLGRETLVPSTKRDLPPWQEQVFIALSKTALSATEFFCIPPGRVIELGTQVEV